MPRYSSTPGKPTRKEDCIGWLHASLLIQAFFRQFMSIFRNRPTSSFLSFNRYPLPGCAAVFWPPQETKLSIEALKHKYKALTLARYFSQRSAETDFPSFRSSFTWSSTRGLGTTKQTWWSVKTSLRKFSEHEHEGGRGVFSQKNTNLSTVSTSNNPALCPWARVWIPTSCRFVFCCWPWPLTYLWRGLSRCGPYLSYCVSYSAKTVLWEDFLNENRLNDKNR